MLFTIIAKSLRSDSEWNNLNRLRYMLIFHNSYEGTLLLSYKNRITGFFSAGTNICDLSPK